ncbi:TPA: hypothetical protein DEP96_01490 [Candidatus Uhrbacteria bacterium]|nr:hypothetical protein [Candidatus Uhrbacteria bacterium]
MPRHTDQSTKNEILSAIKDGLSVADAAIKYTKPTQTIYAWLRGQVDNIGTSALEVAKLRRENTELKEIIGWLTLEKRRGEKNHRG